MATTAPTVNTKDPAVRILGDGTMMYSGRSITTKWAGTITVGPDLARYFLTLNTGNRPIRPKSAEYIAKQIRDGEWQADSPMPVVFSDAGRLLDGQHRLQAIVDAGRAVQCRVEFGARDGLREYIDTGTSRTLGDRVQFGTNPSLQKYIVPLVNAYNDGGKRHIRCSPERAKEIFAAHHDAILFAANRMLVCQAKKPNRLLRLSPVWFAAAQMYERDDNKAVDFADALMDHDRHLAPVKAATMLREFILGNGGAMARDVRAELYGKSVCAMKAFLAGKEIQRLTMSEWE